MSDEEFNDDLVPEETISESQPETANDEYSGYVTKTSVTEYKEEEVTIPWMRTHSGKKFNPLDIDLDPSNIVVEDIAHSLSMQCRFRGQSDEFLSIAEHSVRARRMALNNMLGPETEMACLMYESAAAYLGDVISGLKSNSLFMTKAGMESFADYEDHLRGIIFSALVPARFISKIDWEYVKYADKVLLATEARDLMRVDPKNWNLPEPLPQSLLPTWEPKTAKKKFLDAYYQLRVS